MLALHGLAKINLATGLDFFLLSALLSSQVVWLFATFICAGAAIFLLRFKTTPQSVQADVYTLCRRSALIALGAALAEALFSLVSSSGMAVGSDVIGPRALAIKVALRLLGVGLLYLGFRNSKVSLLWGGIAGVLILASFGVGNHISWQTNPFLASMLLLHVLFAAFWLGSLWCILYLVEGRDFKEMAEVLNQFNRLAVQLLPIMLTAGVVMAWQLVDFWWELFTTVYGITLLAKVFFFLCSFGLGVLNKLAFTPGLAGSRKEAYRAAGKLQMYVRLEVVFIGLIFFCTALLSTFSPASP